ncbi:transcription initiation factor IIB [Candidatus Hecatella orcuttiae]|jgi:transcription initiation factor TFIIB|uniref:transcription initiation factor IIB n=1 Tax=Candidatus Hecatella orcuttiae TaxID=1935119 RepID=UPI00286812BB|nr:transcription initiation factor IIB [Candidatus Hecatella orcuttiae]
METSSREVGAGRESRCPECGSTLIVESGETGEVVCGNCGLVLNEVSYDRGPEWRAFTPEEKAGKSRVGGPVSILQADKGLPTVIDKVGKDAFGRKVDLPTRRQMLRLRKWQTRTQYQSPVERNLLQALAELDRLADKLHIPEDLQEEAAEIYRKALDKGLVRGRSISAIVAAALYAACRAYSKPRSLKEIASVSRVKKKDIARCYRLLLQEIDLKMPIPDPRNYISKIATKANIPEKTRTKAIQLLSEAEEKNAIVGKDPVGLAAAALYIACVLTGEKETQKDIAEAAGVTEVTVRNRYKGLKEAFNLNV